MERLLKLDLYDLFVPKASAAEVVVRAVVAYVALCLLLRVIHKRQVGRASVSDMIFGVIVGGVVVRAVVVPAESLADFALTLATILLVGYATDYLAFRFPWVRHLVHEPPTCLVRDGRILEQGMRREMMTHEDLMRELRRQDVGDLAEVSEAHLEADGEVSVLTRQGEPPNGPAAQQAEGGEKDGEGEAAELQDFLAAAGRLRGRLDWHRERVAKLEEALASHGVRARPPRPKKEPPEA